MLTLRQVAKELNIAYITCYNNYIIPKKIKSIKLDGMYRVKEEDLNEFIKNREYKGDVSTDAERERIKSKIDQ